MAYVERTSQSWLSRIVGSFVGVLIGIVLFIAAFPVLFINEKWSIDRIRDLRDAESQLVSVEAGAVDPGNEGKLVHLNGEAITEEILKFADFGIEENAIRLRRDVEMYQWQEHKDTEKRKKLGGGEETVTTYTYSKTWADRAINSSGFKEAGHDNPSSLPFSNDTLDAKDVLVGSYQLSATMIDQYDRFTPLPLGNDAITKLDGQIRGDYDGRLHVRDNRFYLGDNPASAQIGDTRIGFAAAKPGPVTVLARQVGNTFEPWTGSRKSTINRLEMGTLAPDELIGLLEGENRVRTWIFRGAGTLMMIIGLGLVMRPLSVIADVVPFIGNIVGAGTGLVALLLGGGFSLLTIGLGWAAFRPLVGLPILIVAVGLIMLLIMKARAVKTG